jgi:cysteine synthase A
MHVADDATELVGGTPLVRLSSFPGNVLAKVESFNPMSSVKDRIGVQMIDRAEREGLIDDDTTIIEPTSGNTGIGLAYTCAARDYDLVLTMPDSMSTERRSILQALGVELVLTPGDQGMNGSIDKARELAEEREKTYVPQQFQNPANPEAHRRNTGPEIWEATDGNVDALVAGAGTGGTITGITEYFKERRGRDDFRSIAVEPAESAVLSGEEAGSHEIQGIGAGFVPEILREELIDDVVTVEKDDAMATARRLARDEGIFAGLSAGAALYATTQVVKQEWYDEQRIVVILPDTGERYLSTELYGAEE